MKQLPNILTVLRIVMTAVLIDLFLHGGAGFRFGAGLLFIGAAVTDFFDGYLARRYEVISRFGKIMDPIADKFLMLSVFALFVVDGIMPLWILIVIAMREIGITVWRLMVMARGAVLAAERAGKIKTVIQMVTASLMFAFIIARDAGIAGASVLELGALLGQGLFYLTAGVTLVSGFLAVRQYTRRERPAV